MPHATVRLPLPTLQLERYRWAVAPRREFLRQVVRRASRRRGMVLKLLSSNFLLTVAAVVGAGAGLALLRLLEQAEVTFAAIESYFILFVIAAFHLRSRFEEGVLRRHTERLPRWYLLHARQLGIRANVRAQLAEALRAGNSLRAWRIIEELLAGRGTAGPTIRWIRSGPFGWVWNLLVLAQYVCWLLIFLSTVPGHAAESLRDYALIIILQMLLAMIVVILFGHARFQRIAQLADPTSWSDRCVNCGYHLRGLQPVRSKDQPVIVCPECGTAHGA